MGIAIMHRRMRAGGGLPEYTYTGAHRLIDDGSGNWRIKLLSSGTLTMKRKTNVDMFLVGGGAGGSDRLSVDSTTICGGPGGGGGYTRTVSKVILAANTAYAVTIGAGGAQGTYYGGNHQGGRGGMTQIVGGSVSQAATGGGPGGLNGSLGCYGGAGGSGGGGDAVQVGLKDSRGPYGGSDGSNSRVSYNGAAMSTAVDGYSYFGRGQRRTTREFGESSGTLYSGGGGSGVSLRWSSESAHTGGAGGGGSGGALNGSGAKGTDNTGGGGGGAGQGATYSRGGAGGSGIIIIRNAR